MFVDFQKAFDSVWRAGLWSKLLIYDIEGKVLSVIRNMYHNIKSCIVTNNEASDFFCCGKGLRQGEHLSPILFSIFLIDLENYMFTNNGFNLELNDDYLDVYLKLIIRPKGDVLCYRLCVRLSVR